MMTPNAQPITESAIRLRLDPGNWPADLKPNATLEVVLMNKAFKEARLRRLPPKDPCPSRWQDGVNLYPFADAFDRVCDVVTYDAGMLERHRAEDLLIGPEVGNPSLLDVPSDLEPEAIVCPLPRSFVVHLWSQAPDGLQQMPEPPPLAFLISGVSERRDFIEVHAGLEVLTTTSWNLMLFRKIDIT